MKGLSPDFLFFSSLPLIFWHSTHFASQHTLLLSTLCILAQFDALWNTLLPRTVWFLKVFKGAKQQRRKIYKGAKCPREQRVPRTRVFQEATCAEEQSVPRSRVCQGAKYTGGTKCSQRRKCFREQIVCQPQHNLTDIIILVLTWCHPSCTITIL